jgi:hypothetical protein
VGSVGSIAAGGITAASFAANSITASALASDAADEIIAAVSGTADSGNATTIVDAARTEADTDYWVNSLVLITSGSTVGQIRRITAFDPGTDTITVDPAFTQAISTNNYLILRTAIGSAAGSAPTAAQIADAVWDEALAGHVAAGSTGEAQNTIDDIFADTNDIQTRLPASLIGGRMRSHVEAMDAGVITATVIATGAIDADALATDAVNEIADGVWDELRAGHVIAGSFGEGVASVQGNVTGSVGSVTGNVGGNVVGSVGSVALNGITASSLDATAIAEIADGVWDEDIVAAHGTADTSGLILSQLTKRAVTLTTAVLDGSVIGQILDDGTAVYDRTTDSLQAIADAGGGGPTAAQIADAVWDELRAGHVIAGSFGEGVASVQGNVTGSVGSVTGNVGGNVVGNVNGNVVGSVGSIAAGGITAASFAANSITSSALDVSAVNEIVDQTWDELIAGHLGVGSTGEALNNAGSGASAAVIADAVWDEALAGHVIAGSAGANQNLIDDILAAMAVAQADLDNLQTRLPATLNGGRMRSHVEACDPPCTPTAGGGGGAAVDTFEGEPL